MASVLGLPGLLLAGDPALAHLLARTGHSQRPGRDALGDHRARAHVGPRPDGDGRHEARVGADERAGADHGLVLVGAGVVAGDRARADVRLVADGGVPDIREVGHLGAAADLRLLQLHEVADLGAGTAVRLRPQAAERPGLGLGLHDGVGQHAIGPEGDAVADAAAGHVAAGPDDALGAYRGRALQDDAWIDHRVGPDRARLLHLPR